MATSAVKTGSVDFSGVVYRSYVSWGGILCAMELTDEDRQVAKVATSLLAEQGRPDLAVSPRQLVRWRQEAHAIPVEGERRGGRHRSTRYRPEAPQVAASLAIALDDKPRPSTDEA